MVKKKSGKIARKGKRTITPKRNSRASKRVAQTKRKRLGTRAMQRAKVQRKKIKTRLHPKIQIEKISEQGQKIQPEKEILVEEEVGKIAHFYTHINVGVLEVTNGTIKVGDKIRVKGETTDFIQTIKSLQLDHRQVQAAVAGQSVGLRVDQRVREHDKIFLIE